MERMGGTGGEKVLKRKLRSRSKGREKLGPGRQGSLEAGLEFRSMQQTRNKG